MKDDDNFQPLRRNHRFLSKTADDPDGIAVMLNNLIGHGYKRLEIVHIGASNSVAGYLIVVEVWE